MAERLLVADFVAKVGCDRWSHSAIRLGATGFDLPALTPSTPSNATRCTEPERVAAWQPEMQVAAGSVRWRPEQTHPGRLAGPAVEADRASGCASSVRTASRSFCVHGVIARRLQCPGKTGQRLGRAHGCRAGSCETGPSGS